MPTHAERRNLPYSPKQLYDLVADVEKYPEFLPWTIKARVTKRTDDYFLADLIIGYKLIREKFGSKVMLDQANEVRVEYLSGPMRYLSNKWQFIAEKDGSCTIDFYVDFEFKNPVLQGLMEVFFHEAVKRMVGAFEQRAADLYGSPH